MGKKSKRQKGSKVDANEVILRNILNKMINMRSFVQDSMGKRQYSEAASRGRDVLTYVATQEKAITKASMALAKTRGDRKGGNHFAKVLVERYSNLLYIEYALRKKFGEVIEIYNEIASKYSHVVILGTQVLEENMSSDVSFDMKIVQLLYELALIRTGKNLCNIPIINSFILREMRNEPTMKVVVMKEYTIDALRVSKEYDNAIDLDSKLLHIPNLLQRDPFEVKASLLISYLERYRVEKYQSVQSAKARNYSLMIGLFNAIPADYKSTYSQKDNHDHIKFAYMLAAAQLSYLCHKMDNEQHEKDCIKQAIGHVQCIAFAKWLLRSICSTCKQKSNAPSELQLLCRDCRVSCYCDIDHQRESWMKNEIKGTRLGHKVFCPVLKAYRIWMEAKEIGDEERKAKMEARFKTECIDFLANGLGLKDKCFKGEDFAS